MTASVVRAGGGADKVARQHKQGKLTARERIALLCDEGAPFVEIGLLVAYDDYEGPEGRTHAEFSVVLIERATRRVVWSSHSDNHGSDGVRFFGRGRSTNAQGMATQMVGLATEMIANGRK